MEQDHTYAQFLVNVIQQLKQHTIPSLLLSVTQLLHHMDNIFQDSAPSVPTLGGMHIDHKRLQRLRAKKIFLGISRMTTRRSRIWAAYLRLSTDVRLLLSLRLPDFVQYFGCSSDSSRRN